MLYNSYTNSAVLNDNSLNKFGRWLNLIYISKIHKNLYVYNFEGGLKCRIVFVIVTKVYHNHNH